MTTDRNRGLSPLEGLCGLSLCLNAPGGRAVTGTGGGYAGSSTTLALLGGESFTPTFSSSLLRLTRSRSENVHFHRLLSMSLNSGLFGLLVSILITCHSPSLPPPFFFHSPLNGNNSAVLPKRCSSETQRSQIASGQSIPLRGLRSLRSLHELEICFYLLHDWQVRIQLRRELTWEDRCRLATRGRTWSRTWLHFECSTGHGCWWECEVLSTTFQHRLSRYH